MIRFLIYSSLALILYLTYGFYLSQVDLQVTPPGLRKSNPPGYYDYRGVINVRTNLSNGSSRPQRVIQEAKNAGLDFLILTDVNYYNRIDTHNGYNGSLLVMEEGEYRFLDSRLLYIASNRQNFPDNSSDAMIFFADILSRRSSDPSSDLVILAHPFNPDPTWTGSYPEGLSGIEVVNPRAISQKAWRRSKVSVLWSLFTYPFNPRLSFLRLFKEPREELTLWDQLSAKQKTLGFAGSDASARAVPLANYLLRFPSYQRSFEFVSNHVLLSSELTGQFQKDKSKLLTAIKKGNFYFSIDILGDPKGFIATLESEDKQHLMGTEIPFKKGQRIKVKLPAVPTDFFEIALVKNGETIELSNTDELNYEIKEPGVYRVYVRVSPTMPLPDGKKWITWIYTNPFYVL